MSKKDVATSLVDYLATGIPPASVDVIAPTATPIAPMQVVEVVVDEFAELDRQMDTLLSRIKLIGLCAKDLHYRAKGKAFYGLHVLADIPWEVEKETDDLIEVYYMGFRAKEPPRMKEIYAGAVATPIAYPEDSNYFIVGLMHSCKLVMNTIEGIKTAFPQIPAGVHAVLDSISQKCLLSIGLLTKCTNEKDAESLVRHMNR